MDFDLSRDRLLLVRADDIGSSHAANLACLEVFRQGIARSVEIMAPGPWFEEAVLLLADFPGYDVGVHLTLTSEWVGVKWRPLTHADSLVDTDGYFYPFLWASPEVASEKTLLSQAWNLNEVEAEFRAQIELTRRKLPQVSHLSSHMGCSSISEEVKAMTLRLAQEYGLAIDPARWGARRFTGWDKRRDTRIREAALIDGLRSMEPGLSVFVEHPGMDTPELQATAHPGYEDVARDRALVTEVWTSPRVKAVVEESGIRLVGYRDLLML